MISLLFRVGADTSPFIQAVKGLGPQMSAAGTQLGAKLGSQIQSGILRFIGAGAIISTIKKLVEDAVQITAEATQRGIDVEAMQELQRAAELTGLTLDKLIEAARVAPQEFTKLMEAIQASGGIIDREVIKELTAAGEAWRDVKAGIAPAAAKLLQAVAWFIRVVRAGVTQTFGDVYGVIGNVTNDEVMKKEAELYKQDALDIYYGKGRGKPTTDPQAAARDLVEARRRQQARIGAIGIGLEQSGKTLAPIGPAVPFLGNAVQQMVEELKGANKKLQELNTTVDEKL